MFLALSCHCCNNANAAAPPFSAIPQADHERKATRNRLRADALEGQLFRELRERVGPGLAALRLAADCVAQLDVVSSFAVLALEENYTW